MYLSRESGFYERDGAEVYIPRGQRYADNDPAVKACPTIMDKISDDGPAPVRAVRAAMAAIKNDGPVPQPADDVVPLTTPEAEPAAIETVAEEMVDGG